MYVVACIEYVWTNNLFENTIAIEKLSYMILH